nr:unnamed protein product [Callosobruchus analis]
MHSQMSIKY